MATLTDPDNRPRRTTTSAQYVGRAIELAAATAVRPLTDTEAMAWGDYLFAADAPCPAELRVAS